MPLTVCDKCGKKLDFLKGKKFSNDKEQIILCESCYFNYKNMGVDDSDIIKKYNEQHRKLLFEGRKEEREIWNKHKKKIDKDPELTMAKDLIINVKQCPNLDAHIEVVDMEEIKKFTSGYCRQYVMKFEDQNNIVYVSPPFYYKKKKQ